MKPLEEVSEREAWGRRCGEEMAERKAPGDGSGAGPDKRGRGRGTGARSRAEEMGDRGGQRSWVGEVGCDSGQGAGAAMGCDSSRAVDGSIFVEPENQDAIALKKS